MIERNTYNELVGRNILRAKAAQRMPDTQLQRQSGVSRQTLWHLERGVRGCTVHTLYLIAQGLGVSPAELLPDPRQIQRSIQTNKRKT